VEKLQRLVTHFTQSPVNTAELRTYTLLRMIKAVVTRWWSELNMMRRIVDQKDALVTWAGDDDDRTELLPDQREWLVIGDLIRMLTPVEVAGTRLGATKTMTHSRMAFELNEMKEGIEATLPHLQTGEGQNAASVLLDIIFPARFGEAVPGAVPGGGGKAKKREQKIARKLRMQMLVSAFFDLRFRTFHFLHLTEDDRVALVAEIRPAAIVEAERVLVKLKARWIPDKPAAPDAYTDGSFAAEGHHIPTAGCKTRAEALAKEVDAYIARKTLMPADTPDAVMLRQFELAREQFPLLFEVAKARACIPASSTGCERTFSKASYLWPKSRARLSGEKVMRMLSVRDSMHS